jgi:hypothetical protein
MVLTVGAGDRRCNGEQPLAWYRNHYQCARCSRTWADEWSCMCDDDCPHCGARHMSPFESEYLTTVIEASDRQFIVLRSPEEAEHHADYHEIERFPTREQAEAFVAHVRGLMAD